jgi:hypothetical protein
MPAVGTARPLAEEAEAVVEARRDLVRAQMPHARPRELDRERDAVQPLADLSHRAVGLARERKAGARRRCAIREQLDRLAAAASLEIRLGRRDRERRHLPHVLSVDVERLAARGEDRQPRTAAEQEIGELRGALDDVLTVVEHEQHVPVADAVDELILRGELDSRARAHETRGRRDGGGNLPARARRDQVGAAHARREGVRDVIGHLPGEPALPATSDAGQCHEAVGGERRRDPAPRVAAADEARARPRGCRDGRRRGFCAVRVLQFGAEPRRVDPHRSRDVLEWELAEVGEVDAEPTRDLVERRSGDRETARRRQSLDPRRDVHSIAADAISLDDYVAEVQADPERHPL